ncbi:MAG: threonine--tRNA ligase [Deltaproteobacteria bacterium]|nr:threonine--tRNA ligase [Deltaproteobacteria bacterium]
MVCRPGFEDNPTEIVRHSAAHIMASAVVRLFPNAKPTIGPVIEDGFFYDFDYPPGFTENDLQKIEDEMRKIIKSNAPFERIPISREEAIRFFEERGDAYKVEIINDLPADAALTLYKHGDFTDLCRGPHVGYTKKVKAFKLLSIAGAYWRGDETKAQLQRIYGTAFLTREELDAHLVKIEEAKKRDHRRIGKDLELFSINENIGGGLVLWHPKGARIRHIIESFWKDEHFKAGYDLLYSPHIGRADLWETSGHLGFYSENMYSPMDIDELKYYIKPMNCPFHIMVYKDKLHSYRDLPYRWAELGTVYRYERSGVLHGLMRVRGFTQDDAHIICTKDQMQDEVLRTIRFCLYILRAFGFDHYEIYLATKPKDKYVGDVELWQRSEEALRRALDAESLSYQVDEGGGAFYGPKIDIKIEDAIGRKWQCSTIQFDFNLPERFDMTYVGADGQRHRPYMVHRALLGSLERFFGVMIEHYAGHFPFWLSPVQIKVLTIADDFIDYAGRVTEKLKQKNFRVECDSRGEKLGYKIREAQLQKVPYMIVIGEKENTEGTLSVRHSKKGDLGSLTLDGFLEILIKEQHSLQDAD